VGGALGRAGGGLRGLLDRVDALDGHITLDSPPGQGATVHAWVPLPPDEGPPETLASVSSRLASS